MTDLDVVVFKKNGSQFWVSTNNGCHYTLPSNQPVMVSSDLYLFKHTQLEQRCDGKISTIEDLDKILN
jgi:hypothetical protein